MANPNVLTTASIITCPHGGTLIFTGVKNKLRVQGNSVLLKSDIENASVSNCSEIDSANSPTKQCKNVFSVTAGESKTLKVGNDAVVLATMTGYTDGYPPPPAPPPPPPTGGNMAVRQVQSKLTAAEESSQ